jgi:hypothetical protein
MFSVTFDALTEPVSTEEWVRQTRVAINQDLEETGAVLIRGLAMHDPGDFNRFVTNAWSQAIFWSSKKTGAGPYGALRKM